MDAKKRIYIENFLAEGSSKTVFTVDASIRSGGDYTIKTSRKSFTITQTILENIYVDVPPEIDSKDIVVSRIAFTDYIDYYNNVNNINCHLLFGRNGYAPKIYGIVTSVEPKPHNLSGSIGFARVPGYPAPLFGLNKDIKPGLFADNFLTMYIFQEKCIADLKIHIDRFYNKIKRISSTHPEIIDKAINEMIDNRVIKYLDNSINSYIDVIGAIELDYKPGNICLQKIDESVSASSSASINYKWTSFDFDDSFTRGINQIPKDMKSKFIEYAKIYMKVIFFITLAFCFRTNKFSSPEIAALNEKTTQVMAEKIIGVYHINYDNILEMIKYFVNFNQTYNVSLKVFFGKPIRGYPYMKNTPEFMLRFYAEQYYNHDNGKSGKSLFFKRDEIEDAYNEKTNPVERDAKIICGILGLDFPGSSGIQAMSQQAIPFTSNPYEINPFISGQMLPPPPIQENEVLIPPNPDEIPITSPRSNGLMRQDGVKEQDGGRKRKNIKSKKNKKHKRKSRKHTHSRK